MCQNKFDSSQLNYFLHCFSGTLLFWINKTGIVDIVVVYSTGPRGWVRARGGLGK
jgi:hypothetical protein